jgi:hypothetical protein
MVTLYAVWDYWLYRGFAIARRGCYGKFGATGVGTALAVLHHGMSGDGRAVLPRRYLQVTGVRSPGSGFPHPTISGGAKPEPVLVRIQLGWVPSDHIWVVSDGPGASGLPGVPGMVAHRKGARIVRRPDRRRSGEVGSR